MGQAKKRGSIAERIAQAQGLIQRSLDDIRRELSLPDNAVFMGYGIHLEDRDEFLGFIKDGPATTQRAWAKNPVNAMTYGNFSDAFADSKKCPGSIVVGMFDLGNEIYVAQVGNTIQAP